MKTTPMPLLLALLTGPSATAQEPAANRPPPVPPLIAFFDADHDGTLSAAEINNAAKALAKLDRNGDGKITLDEMRPPRPDGDKPAAGGPPQGTPPQVKPPQGTSPQGMPPQRMAPQGPPPPVIQALDADKNGSVSAEELRNSSESLKKLDNNADGELSIQELLHIGPPPPPPDGNNDPGRRPQGPPPIPRDGPADPLDGE
jgi:hypothetical protein